MLVHLKAQAFLRRGYIAMGGNSAQPQSLAD